MTGFRGIGPTATLNLVPGPGLTIVTWHGLSRAMHHHTYELAPTVAELRGWHGDVTALLLRLVR